VLARFGDSAGGAVQRFPVQANGGHGRSAPPPRCVYRIEKAVPPPPPPRTASFRHESHADENGVHEWRPANEDRNQRTPIAAGPTLRQ